MQAPLIAERFELLQVAGSGGMGKVYRARDRATGEQAAVKVLHPYSIEQARFEREGAILAGLHHPGIVRYLAHGRTLDDEHYIAMEWLEGEDLSQRLVRQPLSIAESVTLGLRLAEALQEAHRHGVVHRDIKPDNLFLVDGSVDRVKILDFGVAQLRSAGRVLTHTGVTIGTPGYVAPEQVQGAREIDARADVFSVGCVLFRCITGRQAFQGSELLAVLLKVMIDDVPHVRDLRDDVPPALDALIARMLAKSPADRPRDGGELAAELSVIHHLPRDLQMTSAPVAMLTGTEQRLLCALVAGVIRDPHAPASISAVKTTVRVPGESEASPSQMELETLVKRFGGKLHLLVDGSLVVTLAEAGAATDQAVKAARCALAVKALLPSVPMSLVAGRAVLSGAGPMGTAIDRGVELLHPGNVAEVRVDSVIAGLLDDRFDVRRDAVGELLYGERDLSPGARKLLGAPTRCVGRDPELHRLASYFEECVAEPMARVVLVTAPAGVGKSRLAAEFIRRIRQSGEDREGGAPHILPGHADLMSAGSPFAILGSALRGAFGVDRALPLAARRQQIQEQVARHFAATKAAQVASLLGDLMGVPLAARDSVAPPHVERARESVPPAHSSEARTDPSLLRDQMLRVFVEWLGAEASEKPVLIVLEDLHWGDLPSISFIDAALRSLPDLPILVLALARPEIHEIFPKLWASRVLVEVKLGPLSRRASERLAREVLGESTESGVIEAVVTRGAGNAFYLEELIRAVAEGKGDALPETVLAMAEARLDRLDPEARRVLRAASVFGEIFWKGGVLALLGGEEGRLSDLLSDLDRREVIERRGAEQLTDDDEYAFRHALMRDAAYAMLTEADRTRGHGLAGAFLERAGEEDAILLAEHFERGGEPARALGWYCRAAQQALAVSDLAATIARAERAITCGASGVALGELRLCQAEAHTWRNELLEASHCWSDALAILPEGSALFWQAAGGMLMIDMQLGDMDRFNALAHRLQGIAVPPDVFDHPMSRNVLVVTYLCAGGHYTSARVVMNKLERIPAAKDPIFLGWMGWARCLLVKYLTADPWRHVKEAEASAEGFRSSGNRIGTVRIQIELAMAMRSLGAFAEAEKILCEAHAAAKDLDAQFLVTIAENHLSAVLREVNRLDEAEDLARAAMDAYLRSNNRILAASARVNLATILLYKDDLASALKEATEAAEALRAPPAKALALALKAKVLLSLGEVWEALRLAEEAMVTLDRLGAIPEGDALVRLVYPEALYAAGRMDETRTALARAKQRLLDRAAAIEDLQFRQMFLENIDEHRRTLEWGAALVIE
jgi:hypothetical protein